MTNKFWICKLKKNNDDGKHCKLHLKNHELHFNLKRNCLKI